MGERGREARYQGQEQGAGSGESENERLPAGLGRVTGAADHLAAEGDRSMALLDATMLSIPDALMTYGPAGEVTFMNSAAEKLFGYTPEQRSLSLAERLELLEFERPEGGVFPVEETPTFRALQGETSRGVIGVAHPPSGKTIWVSMSAAPIRASDGELLGAVATFADITPLRELQEQREEYILSISHDLRTPLTVVQGRAQLLLRAMEDREESDPRDLGSAAAIVTASRQMSAMLRDLVDTAYLESGQPLKLNLSRVDLGQFIWHMKDQMAGTLQTKRVWVEAHEGLSLVQADLDRLERILMKLISNALKYSDSETKVTIQLAETDGELVTTVSHQGQGLRPEELSQLFQRYERARKPREQREGMGRGLYITRRLVEAHGGRIWAESQWGGLTSFTFTMPVAPAAEPAQGATAATNG